MPAPTNDNYASATALSTSLPGTLTAQTTKDATQEVGEADFQVQDQSVWYTFTPAVSGLYIFKLSAITWNGDTGFNFGELSFVVREDPGSLAGFTDPYDDAGASASGFLGRGETINPSGASPSSNTSTLAVPMVSGTTYYIKVWSTQRTPPDFNGFTCSFTLQWDKVATWSPPANDDIANAEVISLASLPTTVTGDTKDSVQDEQEYDKTQDIWYKMTPASDMFLRFNIPVSAISRTGVGPSGWGEVYFQVYDGSLGDPRIQPYGSGSPIASAFTGPADGGWADGHMKMRLTGGVDYYIRVRSDWRFGNGIFNYNVCSFEMDISEYDPGTPPPANDDLADAQVLSPVVGTVPGSTIHSTWENFEQQANYAVPTVWYKFTLTGTGDYTFTLTKTGTDPDWRPYLEVYKVIGAGPPTSFSDLDYMTSTDLLDDSTGEGSATLDAGDYYIVVSNWDFDLFADDFDLAVSVFVPPPPPAGDDPNTAPVMGSGTTLGSSVTGSTQDATESAEETAVGFGPSVWYKWKAPSAGVVAHMRYVADADNNDLWLYRAPNGKNTALGDLIQLHFFTTVGDTYTFTANGWYFIRALSADA